MRLVRLNGPRAPLAGSILNFAPKGVLFSKNITAMTTLEKITEKLDEIASRASRRRRDVGQLVDALRGAVSTIAKLGAPPTQMTPEERLKKYATTLSNVLRKSLGLRNLAGAPFG